MKVFGVTLRAPSPSDWMLVPLVGALSAYLAALIHQHLGGASLAPVAGLAAAGAIGTALALAGADTEAGWRGVALTTGGAMLGFVLVAGLVAVRGG